MLAPISKISESNKNRKYPLTLITLGDHIRKKRLDSDLEQKEVAELLQVDENTIYNWENNRCKPLIQHYPMIMNFLGYCPLEQPKTYGQRLRIHRTYLGVSYKNLAKILNVDPASIKQWETKDNPPWRKIRKKLTGSLTLQRHIWFILHREQSFLPVREIRAMIPCLNPLHQRDGHINVKHTHGQYRLD